MDHYLGRAYSDSVKIGFESAGDLDECLRCLPRGEELLRRIDREVNGGGKVFGGEGKGEGGGGKVGEGHEGEATEVEVEWRRKWWVGLK